MAANAEEALSHVRRAPPAVAVCDIRMPGHDGLWLAHRIRADAPETAVIMATGVHDVGAAVLSLRHGVIDYLTKPFGRDRLREAVMRGLDWHRAARESRRWREALEEEMQVRRQRLADALSALRIEDDATLDATLSMLTLSDPDVYTHAYRVAALAVSVARSLQLADDSVTALEHAALLHDFGKAGRAGGGAPKAGAADRGGADADPSASGDWRGADSQHPVSGRIGGSDSRRARADGRPRAIRTDATPPRSRSAHASSPSPTRTTR